MCFARFPPTVAFASLLYESSEFFLTRRLMMMCWLARLSTSRFCISSSNIFFRRLAWLALSHWGRRGACYFVNHITAVCKHVAFQFQGGTTVNAVLRDFALSITSKQKKQGIFPINVVNKLALAHRNRAKNIILAFLRKRRTNFCFEQTKNTPCYVLCRTPWLILRQSQLLSDTFLRHATLSLFDAYSVRIG